MDKIEINDFVVFKYGPPNVFQVIEMDADNHPINVKDMATKRCYRRQGGRGWDEAILLAKYSKLAEAIYG